MFKVLLSACVVFFSVTVSAPLAADENVRAVWQEPDLQDPDIYSIFATDDAQIAVQKNQDAPLYFSNDKPIEVALAYDQDAVFLLPDQILDIVSLRIHHGRSVVVRGGHLRGVAPANKTVRGLLWAGGTRGSLHVENMILDTNFQDGLDALLVGGYGNQNIESYPNIYVRNVMMTGVENSDGNPFHADCFQYYGPTNLTYMDGVDCETNTQGFFLAPQHPIGRISLNRVSISYINPERANGYALYLKDKEDDARTPISFDQVYVGRRDTDFGYGHDGKWDVYSIFPHALMKHGARRENKHVTFPFFPEINGSVILYAGEEFFDPIPE